MNRLTPISFLIVAGCSIPAHGQVTATLQKHKIVVTVSCEDGPETTVKTIEKPATGTLTITASDGLVAACASGDSVTITSGTVTVDTTTQGTVNTGGQFPSFVAEPRIHTSGSFTFSGKTSRGPNFLRQTTPWITGMDAYDDGLSNDAYDANRPEHNDPACRVDQNFSFINGSGSIKQGDCVRYNNAGNLGTKNADGSYYLGLATYYAIILDPGPNAGAFVGSTWILARVYVFSVYSVGAPECTPLEMDHIEAVQVVQDSANSAAFVAGLPTLARVFVRLKDQSKPAVPGVSAILQAMRNNAPVDGSPRQPDNGSITVHAGMSREQINDSLNFKLPDSWTTEGPLLLQADVSAPGCPAQAKITGTALLTVQRVERPLRIAWVPVCYTDDIGRICPNKDLVPSYDLFVRKEYPVPPKDAAVCPDKCVTLDELKVPQQPDWNPYSGLGVISNLHCAGLSLIDEGAFNSCRSREFLKSLEKLWTSFEKPNFDQLVAFVPEIPKWTLDGDSYPPFAGGMGKVSYVRQRTQVSLTAGLPAGTVVPPDSVGNVTRYNSDTLAHEIAHNFGNHHPAKPYKAGGAACGGADASTDWPYATSQVQQPGWDADTGKLTLSSYAELMSYCQFLDTPRWISKFTFNRLAQGFGLTADPNPVPGTGLIEPDAAAARPKVTAPVAGPVEQIIISGWTMQDGSAGGLDPVYHVLSSDSPPPSQDNGSHCLRFSGASGNLASYCFQLAFRETENDQALDRDSFTFKLPFPAGTTRIAFVSGDQEIAALTAPSAPPSISITSPQTGDRWTGGSQTIVWSASDPDGQPLAYGVFYSADGGQSWLPMALDLSDSQYALDPSRIAGGTNVMFRVIASDGLGSASADVGPLEVVQTPTISLASSTLDFRNQTVGQSATQTFTISNPGSGPMLVSSFTSDNPAFRVTMPLAPLTLSAGSNALVTVEWRVAGSGPQTANLNIASNDPANPQVTLKMKGIAFSNPVGNIDVSPTKLDFGALSAGQTKDLVVTIGNSGSGPLKISSFAAGNSSFSVVNPSTPVSISTGDSKSFTVRFAPNAAGSIKGNLTINSDDPTFGAFTVALSGTGLVPVISVSPASLDFGTINSGQTKDLSLTITNNGNAPLTVSAITPTGSAFTVTSSLPPPIAAASSATVTVRFAPTAGGSQTGALAIASNDPVHPSVSVSLTGATPSSGGADVVLKVDGGTFDAALGYSDGNTIGYFVNRLTPSSYPATLKSVQIYFSSRSDGLQLNAPFTLLATSNSSGSSLLTFGSGTTVDFVQTSVKALDTFVTYTVPPRTITSGDFVVGFMLLNPTGIFPAELDVASPSQRRSYTSNDGVNFFILDDLSPDLAGNFAIRATATVGSATTAPAIDVSPTSLDFGSVAAGQTQTRTLVLRSTGSGLLTVTSLSLKNSAFTLINPPQTPFNIGDASIQLTVRFAPTSAGAQSGSLTIGSNDTAHNPLTIPLIGSAILAACISPPSNLVSWWPGDGNANDQTGGNNGTFQGGAAFAAGEVSQAFNFDGNAKYVQIGNPANLRMTTGITVAAWVNPRAIHTVSAGAPMAAIVTKWAQNAGDTLDSDSYGLWLVQNNNTINLFSAIHQLGGREPSVQGGNVPLNSWTHVAMTFDTTGQFVLYVNGQPVTSTSGPGQIFATNHNVLIGREDSFIIRPFDGLIDEVQIFSRALSAGDIQTIYAAGSVGECKK